MFPFEVFLLFLQIYPVSLDLLPLIIKSIRWSGQWLFFAFSLIMVWILHTLHSAHAYTGKSNIIATITLFISHPLYLRFKLNHN